jgi:hypothetical protein
MAKGSVQVLAIYRLYLVAHFTYNWHSTGGVGVLSVG